MTEDQPEFITQAVRDQLELQLALEEYEQAVEEWAANLDQPHVVEQNRAYLEKLWELNQCCPVAPVEAPPEVKPLWCIVTAFLAWLNE